MRSRRAGERGHPTPSAGGRPRFEQGFEEVFGAFVAAVVLPPREVAPQVGEEGFHTPESEGKGGHRPWHVCVGGCGGGEGEPGAWGRCVNCLPIWACLLYIRSVPPHHSVPGRYDKECPAGSRATRCSRGAKGGEGVPHNRARADGAQTLGARWEAKSPSFVRNITLFSAESARLFPQKHTPLDRGRAPPAQIYTNFGNCRPR